MASVRSSKRRSRQCTDDYEDWVVEVNGWKANAGVHVFRERRSDPERLKASCVVELSGAIVQPKNYRYLRAVISIQEAAHPDEGDQAGSVGMIWAVDDTLHTALFATGRAVSSLLVLVTSGEVRVVHLIGARLRYRKAPLRSFEVYTDFDTEDW